MKRINSALKRLERAAKPEDRIVLMYCRKGVEESDYQKQLKECREVLGEHRKLTCVCLRDGFNPEAPYEDFIATKRANEDPANRFCLHWKPRGLN